MAVLMKGLSDRNVALRKTYAVALGHLVRVAKESSVVKLLETLENRYLEAEDEDGRDACLHTLQVDGVGDRWFPDDKYLVGGPELYLFIIFRR